jgi:hypothetical protein
VVAEGQRLVPASHAFEPDIPLPRGFELVDQSSADWSSDAKRYVRQRYRGNADKVAVETFYRREMPLVRWTLVRETRGGGRTAMQFKKAKESCSVTIEDEVYGVMRQVAVEVIVTPAGQR